MMSVKDAYKLPVFNELVKSYRYQEMESIFKAKRYQRWPKDFKEKIENYIKEGHFGTRLVRKILEEDRVLITTKHINKLRKKWKKN